MPATVALGWPINFNQQDGAYIVFRGIFVAMNHDFRESLMNLCHTTTIASSAQIFMLLWGSTFGSGLAMEFPEARGPEPHAPSAPAADRKTVVKAGTQGLEISSARGHPESGDTYRIQLVSYGYAGHEIAVGAPCPRLNRGRVERDHGGLVEWYRSTPMGTEQGFTLRERPLSRSEQQRGHLRIRLSAKGGWRVLPTSNGGYVRLQGADHGHCIRYGPLVAFDAQGMALHARMSVHEGDVLLVVRDQEARYPIVVDPLIFSEASIAADDGSENDNFGSSVAISGDDVLVGAIEEDTRGRDAGAVFAFARESGTWMAKQKLFGSETDSNDHFGTVLSLDNGILLVGAPRQAGGGRVYVFEKNAGVWTETAVLAASDAQDEDFFGTAAALSGTTAVIGAYGHKDGGRAYVFVKSGGEWTQQAILEGSGLGAGDDFGGSVAIDGETLVVSDMDFDSEVLFSARGNAVFVFTRQGTNWVEQQKIVLEDAGTSEAFGVSLALSGDRLVVGASEEDADGSDTGAVFVYQRTGSAWTQQEKIKPNDISPNDRFGFSLALSGNLLIVGSPADDDSGSTSGSAYAFQFDGSNWVQQAKLAAEDGESDDHFGRALDVTGGSVVVGNRGRRMNAQVFDATTLDVSGSIDLNADVDTDGDGFSDEVELAAGTLTGDATSTPFGGQSGLTELQLSLNKLRIQVKFKVKAQGDTLQLSGTLPVPDGFSVTGQPVIVDVGGIVTSFILDDGGRFQNAVTGFDLKTRKKSGAVFAQSASFIFKRKKGNFANELLDEGVRGNHTVRNDFVEVPISIFFNGGHYHHHQNFLYSAKANTTATVR